MVHHRLDFRDIKSRIYELEREEGTGPEQDKLYYRLYIRYLKGLLPSGAGIGQLQPLIRLTQAIASTLDGVDFNDLKDEVALMHLRKTAVEKLYDEIKAEESLTKGLAETGVDIEDGISYMMSMCKFRVKHFCNYQMHRDKLEYHEEEDDEEYTARNCCV